MKLISRGVKTKDQVVKDHLAQTRQIFLQVRMIHYYNVLYSY